MMEALKERKIHFWLRIEYQTHISTTYPCVRFDSVQGICRTVSISFANKLLEEYSLAELDDLHLYEGLKRD